VQLPFFGMSMRVVLGMKSRDDSDENVNMEIGVYIFVIFNVDIVYLE